jgi:hypothetical protein
MPFNIQGERRDAASADVRFVCELNGCLPLAPPCGFGARRFRSPFLLFMAFSRNLSWSLRNSAQASSGTCRKSPFTKPTSRPEARLPLKRTPDSRSQKSAMCSSSSARSPGQYTQLDASTVICKPPSTCFFRSLIFPERPAKGSQSGKYLADC